ncbi:MAG: WecB/TagA/CpsF family glycosyltransferase [Dehalococcoidia bacterium]
MADTVDFCVAALDAGIGLRVATANLDFLARARRDPQLRDDLAGSSICVADGAPVVWLARLLGGGRVSRVPGVDLVGGLCGRAQARGGMRVAMYGSTEGTARAAAAALEGRYPGTEVVAIECPPFRALTPAELDAGVSRLVGAQPDLVLVALGCPRQERFIAEQFERIPSALWLGIGGTFDFYAGKRARAPRLVQRLGAEWAVRLAQEPGRLWRRYLVDDLPVLVRLAPACLLRALRRPRSAPGVEALRARIAVAR